MCPDIPVYSVFICVGVSVLALVDLQIYSYIYVHTYIFINAKLRMLLVLNKSFDHYIIIISNEVTFINLSRMKLVTFLLRSPISLIAKQA
jgi:hypothetical protein